MPRSGIPLNELLCSRLERARRPSSPDATPAGSPCEVWSPATTGARRTFSWPKPAGAASLVPAAPEGHECVRLVAPVWGERLPGARGRAGKAPARCGQAPGPCCSGETRWVGASKAKAARHQEMPPARITPELRGAAKRHPLERIVRPQPALHRRRKQCSDDPCGERPVAKGELTCRRKGDCHGHDEANKC